MGKKIIWSLDALNQLEDVTKQLQENQENGNKLIIPI